MEQLADGLPDGYGLGYGADGAVEGVHPQGAGDVAGELAYYGLAAEAGGAVEAPSDWPIIADQDVYAASLCQQFDLSAESTYDEIAAVGTRLIATGGIAGAHQTFEILVGRFVSTREMTADHAELMGILLSDVTAEKKFGALWAERNSI